MKTSERFGAMVTWTCYGCFGTVMDHDNDGVGWCIGCRRVVDANGVPRERFAALKTQIFDISIVRDPIPGHTFELKG